MAFGFSDSGGWVTTLSDFLEDFDVSELVGSWSAFPKEWGSFASSTLARIQTGSVTSWILTVFQNTLVCPIFSLYTNVCYESD